MKDSVFLPILGQIFLYLSGIPVDRSRRNNLVGDLAAKITSSDGIALVIPQAGTRRYTDYWKSGFYRIALEAKIPVVCGYLDYEKKEAGLGDAFELSGDVAQDMERIRAFYDGIVGRYPEHKSRIRLKEEDV